MKLFNFFKLPARFRVATTTRYTLIAVLLLAGSGCAGAPERKIPDISRLQWPLPPEEARVKYVRWWSGDVDFKKSFTEQLMGGSEISGLVSPYSVTTDMAGNIYVADPGAGLLLFDMAAKKFRFIETSGEIEVKRAADIKLDAEGNLWVADSSIDRVIKYSKEGKFLLAIGKENELKIPSRLSIDKKRGRLYVLDTGHHDVRVYDLSGKFLFIIGGNGKAGREPGYFFRPTGMALDAEGNIYVADTFNFRVQSFTPDGKLRLKFGGVGDAPGNLARPVAVAVDSEGYIYVVDALFNNIQVFDKEGKYKFTIGEFGDDPGKFSLPLGIYIDENDKIYVADQINRVIQVFQVLSEKYKKNQEKEPQK